MEVAYLSFSTVVVVEPMIGVLPGVLNDFAMVVEVGFIVVVDDVEFDMGMIFICKFICSCFISWLKVFATEYSIVAISMLPLPLLIAFRKSN